MTTTQELATIERVDIRGVWSNEASDFTPWLAGHMSELGEALGLELVDPVTEAPVGGYKLDILTRDVGGESDRQVVVENQLDVTDHSHLGQLLTYAAGYEANVVVWIATEFKDEHREALDLLNRRTDKETEFFGVVVEVWKIDESRPAPHFKVVSAPNDWRKSNVSSGRASSSSEREERYRVFFQDLIDNLGTGHSSTNARGRHYHSFPAGYGGFLYAASFTRKGGKKARIELYIDNGDKNWNEQQFARLEESKKEIESDIGGEFEWERLEDKRACRISVARPGSIDDDEETLEEIRDWMIEKLPAFERVFGPRLA